MEAEDGRGEQVTPALVLMALLVIQDTTAGKVVYTKWCAGCHGDNGAGDGVGAHRMIPPPRDFTGAIYQIRTTASGQLPTDADLLRAIDEGLAGSAMPAWKGRLSDAERRGGVGGPENLSSFFSPPRPHAPPRTGKNTP